MPNRAHYPTLGVRGEGGSAGATPHGHPATQRACHLPGPPDPPGCPKKLGGGNASPMLGEDSRTLGESLPEPAPALRRYRRSPCTGTKFGIGSSFLRRGPHSGQVGPRSVPKLTHVSASARPRRPAPRWTCTSVAVAQMLLCPRRLCVPGVFVRCPRCHSHAAPLASMAGPCAGPGAGYC